MISAALSIALCLQYSASSLLRSVLPDTTPVCTTLLHMEAIKLFVSAVISRGNLKHLCLQPLLVIPPAVCFLIMNIVSYVVVANVPATLYVMVMQLKLPATYLCSCILLKKQLSTHQTCAVTFICISCANIAHKSPIGHAQIDILYIFGMLLESCFSAMCSVYLQKMFENSVTNLWIRNTELSLLSIPVYCAIILYNEFPWVCTLRGYMFACLGALGGILVAYTLIYCDAVAKTISSSFSVVLVAIVEHVIYHEVPSVTSVSFYVISLLSVLLYSSAIFDKSKTDDQESLLEEEWGSK